MAERQTKYPCPVCGDPDAYRMWIDAEPPKYCPSDEEAYETGRQTVFGICQVHIDRAKRHAEMRKVSPECFDDNGNIIIGKSRKAISAWADWKAAALPSNPTLPASEDTPAPLLKGGRA